MLAVIDRVDSRASSPIDLSRIRNVSHGAAPITRSGPCARRPRSRGPPLRSRRPGRRSRARPTVSCGRPRSGVTLRIIDVHTGEAVAVGQPGEEQARTARLMSGYWNLPEATAEALLPGGWFRTGDVGYLDADGYLFLGDRLKRGPLLVFVGARVRGDAPLGVTGSGSVIRNRTAVIRSAAGWALRGVHGVRLGRFHVTARSTAPTVTAVTSTFANPNDSRSAFLTSKRPGQLQERDPRNGGQPSSVQSCPVRSLNSTMRSSQAGTSALIEFHHPWLRRASNSANSTPCCSTQV